MSVPVALRVVPYQPRLQLAQILDMSSWVATGVKKGISQKGKDERGKPILRRYKINVLEYNDNSDPTAAPWAVPRSTTSGTGAFRGPHPIYTKGSFVYVVENENGDYEIVCAAPNVQPQIRQQFKLGESSTGHEDNPSGQTPTTGLNPGGATRGSEQSHTTNDSAEDESQDRDDYFETVYTACLKFDADKVNKDISEWAQKINELQEGLLGSDSFLMTAQSQVDTILANPTGLIDQQIANLTKDTALKNAKSLAGLVQEIRRWVLRKTTALINNASGFAPLSTRYIANLAKNETLDTISCLFIKVLQNLEGLIGNALGALANRIINGATCLVENFIGNIIGQIISQITNLVNAALAPISNLLGSVIGFTSEILEFAKSILNFLECDIENICSKIKRYNPLNGPAPDSVAFNFGRVFDSAKGVFDSFKGLADIPENLGDYDFSLDLGSVVEDSLNNCNLGPQSCGPPNVVFWGGNGSGASGNAVLNTFGDIIGVDMVSGGSYTSPPLISFEDNCGNGKGAVGIPILGDPITIETDPGDDDDEIKPRTVRFDEDGEISLCDASDIVITIAGGQGGNSGSSGRTGRFPYAPGQTFERKELKIHVGKRGSNTGGGGKSSYAKGGGGSSGGGGGGGASALYDKDLERYTIVAAGGGGGSAPGGGKASGIGVGLGFGRVEDAMSSNSSRPKDGRNASNGGGGGGGGSQPSNYDGNGEGGNGIDGNGGASGFDNRIADFAFDGYGNQGDGFVLISFVGRICRNREPVLETVTPVVDVVIPNTGYNYLPVPDGSKGGSGRTWAGRCQTIVQRANGKWDAPYSEGRVIRLFYGDKITLPGKQEVTIDCDFTAAQLPGSIETGEKYCYASMIGFDDGSGFFVTPPNIKSMIGFDDTLYGQVPERVFPTSIEFQKYWDELAATPRGAELLQESNEEWTAALGYVPSGGRPDQFGYSQDYPYARSLGFSDQDIRFYLEGYFSKLLGKRIGGIMKLKLEDPDFGPLPSWIQGRAGAGLFDCENDYPYALSLGYNDRDIRYYLENVYLGEIDECMQRKLNDPNWGRVVYYVDITAPGCPDTGVLDDQYNVDSSIGSVYIEDGGFGYGDGDTATVLDCSGNPDAAAKLEIRVNQDGTIIGVDVINPGSNFQCIPEIVLNSDTGINARLLPVLRFNRVGEFDVPEGTIPLQVIDCVGKV